MPLTVLDAINISALPGLGGAPEFVDMVTVEGDNVKVLGVDTDDEVELTDGTFPGPWGFRNSVFMSGFFSSVGSFRSSQRSFLLRLSWSSSSVFRS